MTEFEKAMNIVSESSIINEAYFGKRPEVLELENAIHNLRALWTNSESTKYRLFQDSKEVKALEKVIKKIFGFKEVYISINSDGVQYNAYTIGAIHVIRTPDYYKIQVDKDKGIYDASHSNILTMVLTQSLLMDKDFTDAEVTGIILHEIGHNFDKSAYNLLNALVMSLYSILSNDPRNIVDISINEFMSTNIMKKVYGKLSKTVSLFYDRYPKLKLINDIATKITLLVLYPINLAKRFVGNVLAIPATLAVLPLLTISKIHMIKTEEFADSMSSAYGYGPETIRALAKLTTKNNRNINPLNNRVIANIYGIATLPTAMFEFFLSVHGDNNERCKRMIDKLNRDLENSDYPIGMKKALKQDIWQMEELYNMLVNGKLDETSDVNILLRRIAHSLFAGKPSIGNIAKPNMI